LAGFIPEDKISEIKNTADIIDIISEVVILKKAGKNFLGLCPFHSEKTPSFTVSPDKQMFHCFGCGEGGNVFTFVMKNSGLSFPEAVGDLARRFGIGLPKKGLSPEDRKKLNEKDDLHAVLRQAATYYHEVLLKRPEGIKAKDYLKKRGLNANTVKDFEIGFAPDGWERLLKYFEARQTPHAVLEKAGLIVARKNQSGHYDRFRNRIIFPICDQSGQVVAFGGRVLDDALPKYLNSPESPVYNKSRCLYGLNRAKNACRETGTAFIVEGYLDLLALHLNGIVNGVATLGTALTPYHLRILKGFAQKMILVFDSDAAGIKAAQRSIGVFMQEKVEGHVVVLPADHDPDSFLMEFGADAFREAAQKAPSLMAFLIDRSVEKHGLSIEGKVRILEDMQQPLSEVKDQVAQGLYFKDLSERLDIEETAIADRILESGRRQSAGSISSAYTRRNADYSQYGAMGTKGQAVGLIDQKEHRLEKQILTMMIHIPEMLPEIKRRDLVSYFQNDTLKSIAGFMLGRDDISSENVSSLIDKIQNQEDKRIVASMAVEQVSWTHEGCLKLLKQFEDRRNRRDKALIKQIKVAEANNDNDLLLKLLREKQKQVIEKSRI